MRRIISAGHALNWGCIPSKAVIAAVERYNEAKRLSKLGINIENLNFDYQKISDREWNTVDKIRRGLTGLIKSWNIDVISGEASLLDQNTLEVRINNSDETEKIDFKNLIIATGSRPVSLPGLEINHEFILDTNDIVSLKILPDSIMVVGSGASGIEWTRIFEGFGKEVVLVELAPALAPMLDSSQSERLEKIFKRKRVEFYTSTKIDRIEGENRYFK